MTKRRLSAIADTTLKRKTGARGLRAIMENIMMDTMYKVPSDETIKGMQNYKRGCRIRMRSRCTSAMEKSVQTFLTTESA